MWGPSWKPFILLGGPARRGSAERCLPNEVNRSLEAGRMGDAMPHKLKTEFQAKEHPAFLVEDIETIPDVKVMKHRC